MLFIRLSDIYHASTLGRLQKKAGDVHRLLNV